MVIGAMVIGAMVIGAMVIGAMVIGAMVTLAQSQIISGTAKDRIIVPLIWSGHYSSHFSPSLRVYLILRFHCT